MQGTVLPVHFRKRSRLCEVSAGDMHRASETLHDVGPHLDARLPEQLGLGGHGVGVGSRGRVASPALGACRRPRIQHQVHAASRQASLQPTVMVGTPTSGWCLDRVREGLYPGRQAGAGRQHTCCGRMARQETASSCRSGAGRPGPPLYPLSSWPASSRACGFCFSPSFKDC